ncbi:hypothetical protein NTE_01239 [Candidatus Nitrososphaera evergladensis SR1]|jgi:hypothetical protein|uniref:Uncharacterized protein n=1 Tax=Candidatus Nitrososphaera evergladensis SR1 TaxID=1459636 RepID=A0A075MVK9_9ARCH|nr:hypothetical protein [Candidatus Nitrososphaera evergladensis]AIF83309.1 hypothetical protein NTE_01239 [Candidatus Nitrososphaera evergladensis SR1]
MLGQLFLKICAGSPMCGPVDYQMVLLVLTAVIGSASVGLIGFQRFRKAKPATFS